MGYMRKGVVLMVLLGLAFLAVSPQAVLNVWSYRAVRGFYTLPLARETALVEIVSGDVSGVETKLVEDLLGVTLQILETELNFRPQSTIRVIVDDGLILQDMSGSYQLGLVAISPPSLGSFDDNKLYGPMLHEMTHLAVDYLAHGNYPAWLTEGIAVYLELRHIGSTWIDVEQEKPWSEIEVLDQALNSGSLNGQAAAYWQSYTMVSYLYELGGQESLLLLLNHLGRGETMLNSVKRIYGIDMKHLTREALVSFRTRQEAVE